MGLDFSNPVFEQVTKDSAIVTNGLVMCLDASNPKSYYNGQSVWTDLSKSANNGTIIGCTFTGSNGGALVYNGTTSTYVTVPDSTSIRAAKFTYSVWAKLNVLNYSQCILSKNQTGPSWTSPYLSYFTRINSSTSIEVDIATTGTYFPNTIATTTTTGSINCFTVTYDGSALNLYVNGVFINSKVNAITIGYSTKPLTIGADYGGSPVADVLSGSVYNVALYNRALSQAEITQNYLALKNMYR